MDEEEIKVALGDENSILSKQVKSLVSNAVSTAVEGVQKTNSDLKSEKQKLQTILDSMPNKEQLEAFQNMQKQLDGSEDAKLISEGKLDDVVLRRTERLRSDFDAKLNTTSEELQKEKDRNNDLSNKYNIYRIDNAIRVEASKQGVVPHATDDLVNRALSIFVMEETSIVARDSKGEIMLGEGGKPITPKDYIISLKESAPHFWPPSKGAGLEGKDFDDKLVSASADTGKFIEMRRKQIAEKTKRS